jgi:hypothetical protein
MVAVEQGAVMSRPTFITAHCGHTTTEKYLDGQPLGCCASCAKKLDKTEALKRFGEIRQQIKATCAQCKEEIHPLEQSGLPVGVFWKTISVEKAAELAVNAHIRHTHSDYDQRRYDLQAQGYDSKEARSLVREEDR